MRKFSAPAPFLRFFSSLLFRQFGNMLVLSAVYQSSRMRQRLPLPISQNTIRKLLDRTIKVLTSVAPNSPVLQTDVSILKKIRESVLHQKPPRASRTL